MKKTLIAACAIIAILPVYFINIAAQSGDIRWQDAAKELDALPFSRAFIDSVTAAHLGSHTQGGLRHSPPGKFAEGEMLVYQAGWGPFMAGYFILEARNFRSRGLIRLSAKAMTSNVISAFYKMREHSLSWVDAAGFYPHFFEQHVREGSKYKLDAYLVYDNKNKKLFHKRREEVTEVESPKFTHDYLSLLYYARTMPLQPGDTFDAQLYTRPKTDPVKFKVLNKRETVKTDAGTFKCVIVEPTFLGDSRAFNRKSKIEVWVTDDENKYPVMIKSKAKFGSVQAKLIHISK
ncbi:MAG: DUF3108 domain-containing protein [Chitinispirillia bacterium]|nr:DUF3108 domain-containing protein [Chitinispirillia bacterium]MCL2267975.1 DUF3108 domain-containing protein [Chitinispirillia bacterium]